MSPRVKPKPKPDAIYVATTSFACEAHGVVVQGERRRGSDPVVRDYLLRFALDGTPQSEHPDIFGEVNAHQQEIEPMPEFDMALPVAPAVYAPPRLVRLRRRLRIGIGSDGRGGPATVRTYEPGTLFHADALPGVDASNLFEPLEPASQGLRVKP